MGKGKGIRYICGLGLLLMAALTGCAKDSDEVSDNTVTPYVSGENGQVMPGTEDGETVITPKPTATMTPIPTPTSTPTPTPIPAWKLKGEAGEDGSEQYIYYNDEFDYVAEIMSQDGKLLMLETGSYYGEEGNYFSSLNMKYFDPVENTLSNKVMELPENYYINEAGALEQGGFYVQYGNWQYEVFNESRESVHKIQPRGIESDPGIMSGDGKNVYFCGQTGKVYRAAVGEETEVIYENMGWGDPFAHGLCLNDRYLEIQYYDWQDEDSLTKTAYLDLTTMEVAAEIPGSHHAILSPDGQYALVQEVNPRSRLGLYRVSDRAHICDMELAVWGEAYNYEVDWENGYCLTASIYEEKRNGGWLEVKALDLYTGKQKWVITQQNKGNAYQTQSGLLADGIYYNYVSRSDGSFVVELWDYLTTTQTDTSAAYTRYGILSDELLAYRDELEQKYGIILYLGTEVAATAFDYECEAVFDEERIYRALEALENAFALYPEGFLEQLKSHDIKTLGFYLAGTLRGKYNNTLDYAGGFALQNGYEQSIVLDIYGWDLKDTIIHEMSHWIDLYIDECEMFNFEVSYRNEFEALNPEEFQYNYGYETTSKYEKYVYDSAGTDYDKYYFIDAYAQSNANEDRARCFEYMLKECNTEYLKCPHIYEKMSCMAKYIRKYFDTTNWPEQTSWEKVLAEAAQENTD